MTEMFLVHDETEGATYAPCPECQGAGRFGEPLDGEACWHCLGCGVVKTCWHDLCDEEVGPEWCV